MSRQFLILFFCLALLAPVPARALPEEREIAQLYRRALDGDAVAVAQTIAKLEAIVAGEPANHLARVYLGSSYTLQSRDLPLGPQKLQVLKKGLALMDQAVEEAKTNPRVRLARAQTTSALPGFIGRGGQSRKDFEILAAWAEKTPQDFAKGELQTVFHRAGLAAKASGNRERARVLLRQALAHPADPALVEKTRQELDAL